MNGISRRHIQGSKTAEGLQSVKYFFTVPKILKVGPNSRVKRSYIFNIRSVAMQIENMTLETFDRGNEKRKEGPSTEND